MASYIPLAVGICICYPMHVSNNEREIYVTDVRTDNREYIVAIASEHAFIVDKIFSNLELAREYVISFCKRTIYLIFELDTHTSKEIELE